MSRRSTGRAEDERRLFVADPDALEELGSKIDQLAKPDVRSAVIRCEYPEFAQALQEGRGEIDLGDGPMNPHLHLAMHEVVATQLWDDSPPEVWDNCRAIDRGGYERHEILHMLAGPVAGQMRGAPHEERPCDRARHRGALDALPGSWERDRTTKTAKRHDDARKHARRAAQAARRAERRPR